MDKTYRLMIKTHNKTGKKYLCMTSREDYDVYLGSGVYWLRHLKKHGKDIKTEVVYSDTDYSTFSEMCLHYSTLLNICISEEYANLVPEIGYGNDSDNNNLVLWWKYATEENKRRVILKRNKSIKLYWNSLTKLERDERAQSIGEGNKLYWNSLTKLERDESMQHLWEGQKRFFEQKVVAYESWRSNISNTLKKQYLNVPFHELSERNRQQRLNMTPEKRLLRKQKIQQVYATGKHDEMFKKMAGDRVGVGNPACKIYIWFGVEYTKSQFKSLVKLNGWSKQYVDDMFASQETCTAPPETTKIYATLECPHCNKSSTGKHSAFKRWHFNNCKHNNFKE